MPPTTPHTRSKRTPLPAPIFVGELPPARRGKGGPRIWERQLAPLVARPGEWALIYSWTASRKKSYPAGLVNALKNRQVSVPEGEWEFARRGEEVYARYLGESFEQGSLDVDA